MYTRGFAGLAGDQAPFFSFTKTSGSTPYPNFQVGDSWTITIAGPANAPIFVASVQNGVAQPAQQFGTTDANGNFSFQGTMLASAVGTWQEAWYLGRGGGGPGDPIRNLLQVVNFTVAAPAQSSANATNTTPPPAPPTSPAFVNTVLNSSGLQLGGYDVPWWAVAGVGAGLLFMLSGRHR